MIKISNLYKGFHDLEVLKGIDIEINEGQFFGIIGKSGAGKSTLLRCINGLEKYDKGSLIVDGVEISKLTDRELRCARNNMGMIFQQFSLLTRLNVYDNIALPMRCWKVNNNAIHKRVMELLEVVGLLDKADNYPKELSGGQKQRVAIARALAMQPKILLCDESTSALDPVVAQSIIDLLAEINREFSVTVVMVTHQMSIIKAACEEIVIIENGTIAVRGNPEEIFLRRPEALENLTGKNVYFHSSDESLINIIFKDSHTNATIASEIARDLIIEFAVMNVMTDTFSKHIWGSNLLKIKSSELLKLTDYLNKRNIEFEIIK